VREYAHGGRGRHDRCQVDPGTFGPPRTGRTILRLHRTLEFITLLISDLLDAAPDMTGHTIVADAYSKTLSNHHAWLIRKAAQASFYALPNRSGLVDAIAVEVMPPGQSVEDAEKRKKKDPVVVAPEVKEAADTVLTSLRATYVTVQKLYTDNKLNELP
jgi:hypothetical protein